VQHLRSGKLNVEHKAYESLWVEAASIVDWAEAFDHSDETKLLIAAASVALAGLCAGHWWWHRPAALTAEDYLPVGDLANESGEKDFDGSIREALRVSLAQSPLLNLLSEEKTRTLLRKKGKPAGQRLDAALAAVLCDPLGARAYLTEKIRRSGETYSVELEVYHCGDNARILARTFPLGERTC
jgi:hypothetical protein